jgi:hypothetical protein
MKKIIPLFMITLCLLGCASYKFQRGSQPYDKGYVVSRDGYTIPEYTIGKDNTVPQDLELAKERFEERKGIVEHYYKKMGYIENRFKMAFWDPGVFFLKMIGGVFRLPFVAISDYKLEHNPEYREKIRRIQDEQDLNEEVRIKKLKEQLKNYIQKELDKENS